MYLKKLFDTLNSEKIKYAVLRGYELLPNSISHDIDFCLATEDISKIVEIVEDVFTSHGFNKVYFSERKDFFQFYYYGNNECIKLDFWTGFTYKGLRYFDFAQILKQTKIHNNITVLNESAEVTVSFLKEFLHNGWIRKDKIESLQYKTHSSGFLDSSYFYANPEKIRNFETWLLNSKINLKDEAKKYRRWLFFQNIRTDGLFTTLSNMADYILRYSIDFFKKKGFFVVLVGPDGSGKTTVAKAIIDKVNEKMSCFSSSKYIHGRPGIIPRMSYIARRSERQDTKKMDFDVQNVTLASKYSKKIIIIYMAYYYLDFLLGAFKIFFQKFSNKVIVADRYFYDYFISGHFSNYPKTMYLLYIKLLPTPDLIIFMDGDPEDIYNRKPELPVDAIKCQQEAIKNLALDVKYFSIIDTRKGILTVNDEVNNAICNRLYSRVALK